MQDARTVVQSAPASCPVPKRCMHVMSASHRATSSQENHLREGRQFLLLPHPRFWTADAVDTHRIMRLHTPLRHAPARTCAVCVNSLVITHPQHPHYDEGTATPFGSTAL
eukprot:351335-Chlamydomonas_euryale.AAC.4